MLLAIGLLRVADVVAQEGAVRGAAADFAEAGVFEDGGEAAEGVVAAFDGVGLDDPRAVLLG